MVEFRVSFMQGTKRGQMFLQADIFCTHQKTTTEFNLWLYFVVNIT